MLLPYKFGRTGSLHMNSHSSVLLLAGVVSTKELLGTVGAPKAHSLLPSQLSRFGTQNEKQKQQRFCLHSVTEESTPITEHGRDHSHSIAFPFTLHWGWNCCSFTLSFMKWTRVSAVLLFVLLSLLAAVEGDTVLRPNLYFGTRSQTKDSHLVFSHSPIHF